MVTELFSSNLLEFDVASKYANIISDTFTLIVGFVAIGIPLAIQIASQVTEKYDSSRLAKRLTQGVLVNPVSLIITSIIYILLSILFKANQSKGNSLLPSVIETVLVIVLIITFCLTIVAAAWFFIRLYFRVMDPTEDYIRDFLMLNDSLKLKLLMKFDALSNKSSYFYWIKKLKIEDRFYYSNFTASKLSYVSAGLEVLIEQLKSKSWDSSFVEILFQFHKKVVKTYFGPKKHYISLSKSDVKFIKLYWDALVRIIRVSREAEDAKLSFHSQRLFATMISHIIHDPRYVQIVAEDYVLTSDEKINLSSDLYEIARWQGNQSGKGIDLVIECEWFRELFGLLRHVNFRADLTGIVTANRSIVDVFQIVTKDHPHKVLKFYKNISENLSGDLHSDWINSKPTERSKNWINQFWRDFNKVEYTINNLDVLEDKVKSLSDGRAFVKYGEFGKSVPLNEDDVNQAIKAIESNDFSDNILLRYMKSTGCSMLGELAFQGRWQEIYDCLEWKHPRESNICHLGESLFASSVNELLDLIFRELSSIENDFRFHDRYELSPFVFRGVLYQLCYFCERSNGIGSLYGGGAYEDCTKKKKILNRILEQQGNVPLVGFNQETLDSVLEALNNSIKAIDKRMSNDICNKVVRPSNWMSLKSNIVKGWQENNLLFEQLNVGYKPKVLNIDTCVLKHSIGREILITTTNEAEIANQWGYRAAWNLLIQLYNRLSDSSKKGVLSDIVIDNIAVFASKESLQNLGFKLVKKQTWIHEECAKSFGYMAESENILVVDKNNVQINMTLNPLRAGDKSPIFSYFIDSNELQIELNIEVFYEICLNNDNGIILI
ncbi:hypothetical protein [Shewanella waksmanii]|uniref:hypothetical protein n=1 Tax=Shewanella waksmanii TaxID=213783 RepID=UPI003736E13D